MKTIFISESTLNEILKIVNANDASSASSNVFFGKRFVKKVAQKGEISEGEFLQYKAMEQFPEFFPKTMVKKLKDGTIVILQERLDTTKIISIYDKLDYILSTKFHTDLRMFLQSIAGKKISQDEIDETINFFKKNYDKYYDSYDYLIEFIKIAQKVGDIISSNSAFGVADLHSGNFGVNSNWQIKCFDFQNPIVKYNKHAEITPKIGESKSQKTIAVLKNKIYNKHWLLTLDQLMYLFQLKFGCHFINNMSFFGQEFIRLTTQGKHFVELINKYIHALTYVNPAITDSEFLSVLDYCKQVINVYFPSNSKISKKQFIYFIENYYNKTFETKYKIGYDKDLLGGISQKKDLTLLDEFFGELSETGLPITDN
jgi:hypothetical protein